MATAQVPEEKKSPLKLLFANTDALMAVAFVGIITIIIIPISPVLLDVLLTVNITVALIVLLTTLFTDEPRKLNVFPSILLTTTLFRLALNISSTRLILSEARAGELIAAFGDFVIGGNYVVGIVVFAIITLVQFIVITNGSGRIAEVSARFSLDAMPGRQMSIDADFNAGLIDEEEARSRREDLQKENDFYGSMDGASKFVKGDATAGIVIVLINIIGGFAIGLLQMGMSFEEATQVYTLLTVGDGLVAQVPALLISTSAGMLVSRSTAEASLGEELATQLFSLPKVIILTAALLFFLGLVPGLPATPFFILASACAFLGITLHREAKKQDAVEEEAAQEKTRETAKPPGETDDLSSLVKVELLEIEIGYNLVPMTDTANGGNLLERITAARRKAVNELGVIIQPIRIRDNLQLQPNEYVIKLKGNVIASGEIRPGWYLALNPDGELPRELEGFPTREPTFNLPALWVGAEQRELAETLGCTVVDAMTVLITHLTEVIKTNAHELMGRQVIKDMLDAIAQANPALVDEIKEMLSLGEIQKVMQFLLQESVPVHDMITILETLADNGRNTRDVSLLTEAVRQSLSRTITNLNTGPDGMLRVVTLDPKLEKVIGDSLQNTPRGPFPVLDPQKTQNIVEGILKITEKLKDRGISAVILTSPKVRIPVRRLIERYVPQLPVLSISEIIPEVQVEAVGVIKDHEN